MKALTLTLTACALMAAACGGPAAQSPAGNAASGNRTEANAAAPAAGNPAAAATGPLSAYVGRLPSDEVAGVTFLANPLVRRAVETAVPDAEVRRWALRADVTSNPIALRDGRLFASGCEPHNCGRHWTIQIDPTGAAADVCYSNDSAGAGSSQWYAGGRPVERREGLCPRLDGQ